MHTASAGALYNAASSTAALMAGTVSPVFSVKRRIILS
jgi:hypothetical protein